MNRNLPQLQTSPWSKVALWVGFWTLVGTAFGLQNYFGDRDAGIATPLWFSLRASLQDWLLWGLLAVGIIALARRYPFDGDQTLGKIAIHLAASLITVPLYLVLRSLVGGFHDWSGGQPVSYWLLYWEILAVYHLFLYQRKYYEREMRTSSLQRQLTQARLDALRMQLNPHFLFNTLHSISSLMEKDVKAADRMMTHLSDILRESLDSSEEHVVPLRQEIAFLKKYLAIEETRFGDRLKVEWEIAEDVQEAGVPNLLLQPLVENAVRHGIERISGAGVISITAHREAADRIALEITDNGPGLPISGPPESVGLKNTRERLRQIYNGNHSFELLPGDTGGLKVRLKLPFRPGPPPAGPAKSGQPSATP